MVAADIVVQFLIFNTLASAELINHDFNLLPFSLVSLEITYSGIRAEHYIIWFLMSCSDPMLKKQPHSEKPVEASVPSSVEMKKTENEAVDA